MLKSLTALKNKTKITKNNSVLSPVLCSFLCSPFAHNRYIPLLLVSVTVIFNQKSFKCRFLPLDRSVCPGFIDRRQFRPFSTAAVFRLLSPLPSPLPVFPRRETISLSRPLCGSRSGIDPLELD